MFLAGPPAPPCGVEWCAEYEEFADDAEEVHLATGEMSVAYPGCPSPPPRGRGGGGGPHPPRGGACNPEPWIIHRSLLKLIGVRA